MSKQANQRRDCKSEKISLAEKGGLVESLWHAVDHGSNSLEYVPGLVRRVIKTEAWRERLQDGVIYKHGRFIDFITSSPLAGCGWPPDKVEALIRSDAETLRLWHQAVVEKPGKRAKRDISNNITNKHHGLQRGTSRAYTLARLEKHEPELYKQVVDKKLSAHAAAIKAGFRKKLSPFEQIQKLIPKLTARERKQLLELLK